MYDFSTLNDRDLEELVRDILFKRMNISFQSFKAGSDKGIDLRHASAINENYIIVQVKHYLESGYSQLKNKLKNSELAKIKKLNPQRYILATSVKLSPQNKEELKSILQPYIRTTNDIYGQNELNDSLREFPETEEAHFKLWLTSTTVLKRILNNGINGRSEYVESKILERIKIFVPSVTHKESVDILNQKKFILITGAPGIGKTTLADILTYQLLAQDFKLTYVTEIKEAEAAFDPNAKQVFYFDDFLGAITLDLVSSRNADTAIVNFIERVRNEKNKRLILTCRTTILNQAKELSDAINNSTIEVSKHEVKINDYGNIEKAKILYNHIFFSNLPQKLKTIFFGNNFHWEIIRHRNYTPRIVQFFTDIDRVESENYKENVKSFLNKPEKIWDKAYNIQLSDNARYFMATLFSLGGTYEITENRLKDAFTERIQYEINNHNLKKESNIYNKTLRELLNAFVTRTIKKKEHYSETTFRFLNPSIEDFLYYQFSINYGEEYLDVLRSAKYFEQFKGRITTSIEKGSKRIFLGGENYIELLNIFKQRASSLISYASNNNLDTIICLIRLFHWHDIKEDVIQQFDTLEFKYWNWTEREYLIEILDYIAKNELINEFSISYEEVIQSISENVPSHFLIEKISRLISNNEYYRILIEEAKTNDSDFFNSFKENISRCWEEEIDNYISTTYQINEITDRSILENAIEERLQQAVEINHHLQIGTIDVIEDYNFDVDEQVSNNLSNIESEIEIENINEEKDIDDEESLINNLFNSTIEEF